MEIPAGTFSDSSVLSETTTYQSFASGFLLVVQLLLLLGLFLYMYLLLLSRGLRYQSAALAVEHRDEANSGHDAVTAVELPVLLNPALRFRTRVDALRHDGPRAYRRPFRLYQTQLDLGMCRWRQARQDPDRADVDLARLRRRVQDLKTGLEVRAGPAVGSAVAVAAAPRRSRGQELEQRVRSIRTRLLSEPQ